MADEMPIFPKAGSMLLHTGNIVNWNRLKKKPKQSPTDELKECLGEVLKARLHVLDKTEAQYSTELECGTKNQKLPENERASMKLTVKIYLSSLDPKVINEAVEKVKYELGVSSIEALLVATPGVKDLDFASFQPVWEAMEALHDNDTVYSLGVTDFNKDQLELLHDWAKVKPCIDQVNLENCCIMPPELLTYAKDNDIQLLTHNDPTDILPVKAFQHIICDKSTAHDSENWAPEWLVRYSVLIRGRGIIKTKGYIVKGIRDIKKRK